MSEIVNLSVDGAIIFHFCALLTKSLITIQRATAGVRYGLPNENLLSMLAIEMY